MDDHNGIDLTPYVAAIASVLTDPYQDFVAKLRADNRITDEEIATLTQQIRERGERLGELVEEYLRQDRE